MPGHPVSDFIMAPLFTLYLSKSHQAPTSTTIFSIDRSNHWLDNVLVTGVGTRLRADCCSPWIGECQRNIIVTCTVHYRAVYCAVYCTAEVRRRRYQRGNRSWLPDSRWQGGGYVVFSSELRETMFSYYLINKIFVPNFQNRLFWKDQCMGLTFYFILWHIRRKQDGRSRTQIHF